MNKIFYKILIIEDNPGDFTIVEELLEEQFVNFELIHAENYKESKLILNSRKHKIDVILLDLSLPDKSGEELVTSFFKLQFDCPVIVLTGYSDINFSIKAISLGASDYLLKDELTSTALYKSIVYAIERKKIITELRSSEERYSNLFQLSPLPMWVFDLETLKFIDVNDAAVLHYGYSKEEFLSMTILDIRPEEDKEKTKGMVDNFLGKEKQSETGLVRHKKKNGEIIFAEIQSNAINLLNKKYAIALANDITERTNYIKEIEKQNIILKEIAWMQSHKVRAPLSRVMSLINYIEDGDFTEIELNEILNQLNNSCNELDEIIKQIVNKSQTVG